MPKVEIPSEWELGADPRYKKQNMERAMRGRIERGLVELITNSDDSYRNLEEEGVQASGKIRIEIERRKLGQPSAVIVRDKAEGMTREEMFQRLGTLGKRTSGFEKGKPRRGLHGRGARDVAAFGTVHFESIKDERYNHLIIPPSLKCRFIDSHPKEVTSDIRKKLGISRSNGTVVTIEVESRFRIPQHETLLKDFSRYYSLRDILSNPKRKVTLVDIKKNREDQLLYKFPSGDMEFNGDVKMAEYPMAKTHLVVYKHSTAFEQSVLPYREGILVKSAAAMHDCTYFGLESETLVWNLSGVLHCDYIDNLVREYDDREEKHPDKPDHPRNNPQRLLDPFRDGLILEHPFARALYRSCKEILEPIVEKLKAVEKPPTRDVTDKDLERKLKSLSREISGLFQEKLRELEEGITPATIPQVLSEGLHIIPPNEQPIIMNQPKVFSVIVKHYETLDDSLPVTVVSSDPEKVKIHASLVFLRKFSQDGKVGRTTFTVEGSELGAEVFVEARYGGYSNLVLVKVVPPSSPAPVPDGLSFEKPRYHVQINKEKTLALRLKGSIQTTPVIAQITCDHRAIVLKGGGRCELRETNTPGLLHGQVRVIGRQLKARGSITARVENLEPAYATVEVQERGEPPGGIDFKPPRPVEEDFGVVRYKWDDREPYLLLIGAKHPSIRRYLGQPTETGYPGVSSPLYHAVLAEVIAEALAFHLLSIHFRHDGQQGMLDYDSTDLYYHKQFSEFLSIAHKILVTQVS
jgi:hypothetical protein